jgi:hypothetical protein
VERAHKFLNKLKEVSKYVNDFHGLPQFFQSISQENVNL